MEKFFADYVERFHLTLEDFAQAITGLAQDSLDYAPGVDMNSLVVLVVHTAGSGRFWVGDIACGDPSNRNRASEFEAHGLTEAELLVKLHDLEAYVRQAVENMTLADLGKVCTIPSSGEQLTVGSALIHALEHTALHLGHAQITRQLWDQSH